MSTDISIKINTAVTQAKQNTKSLNNSLKSTASTLEKMGKNVDALKIATNSLSGKGMNQFTNDANKAGNGLDKLKSKAKSSGDVLNNAFSLGKMYFFWNRLKPIMNGLGGILQSALDYTETVNLFQNAMGEMTNVAMEFQNKVSESFGMSATNMMKYQATFKNMLSSLGNMADDTSEKISETLTIMSLDYASLYNIDIENSAQKFQSALSRQVRPIRSVSGYDITQNVLQSSLEQMGIYDRTVKELGEMEKRLLIIYSLQQQMANSNALGDFARTIEQPSNQLRVLKEQLIEVGRWIGSVFYGTIGHVMPYINGFVMAIKELIKTFALFVGYKIEDNVGGGSSYFDQAFGDGAGVEDAVGNIGDGVGGINDELDKTKKKIKEITNATGSIDELNIIQENVDNSSDNSKGKDAGMGSGFVDPRILGALGQYDGLFENMRMKALDIRDALLKWVDILGKGINRNIFEPISNSWDKYGNPIINSFSNGFRNLGELAGKVFDVAAKRWKPFFQAVTDLFFSLLDTAGIVFEGITKFMLIVWDNGGNVLFEQILRLKTSFVVLATSINDNFVKPVLRWISNTIVPVFGTVIGVILKGIGSIIGLGADFILWISKSKVAVVGLTSVVIGLFGAFKISKAVGAISNMTTAFKSFKSMGVSTFGALNKVLGAHFKSLGNSVGGVSKLKTAWSSANASLKPLSNAFSSLSSKVSFSKVKQDQLTASTKLGTVAQGMMAKASAGLSTALTFLSSHPMVALVSIIGIAVGAIALFNSTQDKSGKSTSAKIKKMDEEIAKSKELAKESKKLADSQTEANKQAMESANSSQEDYRITEFYIQKLRDITGSNGYAGNLEQAKMFVEKINATLPDTVKLTEDGIVVWSRTNDEIKEQLKLLADKARVTAYENSYVKAIDEEAKVTDKFNKALDGKKTAVKQYNDQIKEYTSGENSFTKDGAIAQINADAKAGYEYATKLNGALAESDEALKQSARSMGANRDAQENMNASIVNSTFSLKEQGIASAQLQMGYTGQLGKQGELTRSYDDLRSSFNMYSERMKTGSAEEKGIALEAKNYVLQQLSEKAIASNQSYSTMLAKAKENGISLSNEEKSQLKKSYNNSLEHGNSKVAIEYQQTQKLKEALAKRGIDIDSEEGKRYKKQLDKSQKEGKKSGDDYIKAVAKGLTDEKGEVVRKAGDTGKKASDEIKKKGNTKISVGAKVDNGSMLSASNSIKRWFKDNPISLKVTGSGKNIQIKGYATGGLPSMGEMFVARESGPELVGKIGSSNAVVNNNQIIQGVAEGVARAIAPLMRGSNQPQATIVKAVVDSRELYNSNERSKSIKGFSFNK